MVCRLPVDYKFRFSNPPYICIYVIYTPNLGFGIACFDQEREQGRFRGSSEGAGGAQQVGVSTGCLVPGYSWLTLFIFNIRQHCCLETSKFQEKCSLTKFQTRGGCLQQTNEQQRHERATV